MLLGATAKASATSLRDGATSPLACNVSAREFRPYATARAGCAPPNDSYFTAMTYPDGLPSTMQPADIHDATLGRDERGLWRRDPSDRRGPRRDGGCGAGGRARRARRARVAARVSSRTHCRRSRSRIERRHARDASCGAGSQHAALMLASRADVLAPRRASSAGSSTTSCTGTRAACPDRRSDAPSAPSARPRGSRRGSA